MISAGPGLPYRIGLAPPTAEAVLANAPHAMHRIGILLSAILLVPVIAAGVASLMGWPAKDELFYFSIGWVLVWLACYLAARVVVWIIARWVGDDPKSS